MRTVDNPQLAADGEWDFSQYPVAEDWERIEGIEALGDDDYKIGEDVYHYDYDNSAFIPLPTDIYQP